METVYLDWGQAQLSCHSPSGTSCLTQGLADLFRAVFCGNKSFSFQFLGASKFLLALFPLILPKHDFNS